MKLDSQNMLSSIQVVHKQIEDAWSITSKEKVPASYKKATKIALFGMGGSALGTDVARNLFADSLKVPAHIINDYQVPAWIDKDTLVILSSYSGSTEETVLATKEILKRTKKILVITSGKDLLKIKNKYNFPGYVIDPKYNPCGQPRMALGYAITGLLGLLKQAGLVKITSQEIKEAVDYLEKNHKKLHQSAKGYAKKLNKRVPIYVASEHLWGNAHVISNQTNENGKNFSAIFPIPELNHHLMEGLGYPKSLGKIFTFVFINSDLYHQRNQKRYKLTADVVRKNKLQTLEFKPKGKTKLIQSFETLCWGGYLTYYLSVNNKLDPSPIPWVDYFKKKLA